MIPVSELCLAASKTEQQNYYTSSKINEEITFWMV